MGLVCLHVTRLVQTSFWLKAWCRWWSNHITRWALTTLQYSTVHVLLHNLVTIVWALLPTMSHVVMHATTIGTWHWAAKDQLQSETTHFVFYGFFKLIIYTCSYIVNIQVYNKVGICLHCHLCNEYASYMYLSYRLCLCKYILATTAYSP